MKIFAILIIAASGLLALAGPASAADRWGWSELLDGGWSDAWTDVAHQGWVTLPGWDQAPAEVIRAA